MKLEFHQLDRRHEHLRVRNAQRQRQLLASLATSGQQTPIIVVAVSDQPDRYLVIDGYKRVAALEQLGARPELRHADSVQPFVTDGGNFILDCLFGPIEDPPETERRINSIVGVVENGLFVGRSSAVIVASQDGIDVLTPRGAGSSE